MKLNNVFLIKDQGELPYFESRVENFVSWFTDLLPEEITYKDVINRLQNLGHNIVADWGQKKGRATKKREKPIFGIDDYVVESMISCYFTWSD